MIIESGFIIFAGFLFLMVKLPRHLMLKMLGWPITVDVVGSVLAYALHWGSFSGAMSAAVAGMLLSGMTTTARYIVGYVDKGVYTPGRIFNWSQHVR